MLDNDRKKDWRAVIDEQLDQINWLPFSNSYGFLASLTESLDTPALTSVSQYGLLPDHKRILGYLYYNGGVPVKEIWKEDLSDNPAKFISFAEYIAPELEEMGWFAPISQWWSEEEGQFGGGHGYEVFARCLGWSYQRS